MTSVAFPQYGWSVVPALQDIRSDTVGFLLFFSMSFRWLPTLYLVDSLSSLLFLSSRKKSLHCKMLCQWLGQVFLPSSSLSSSPGVLNHDMETMPK